MATSDLDSMQTGERQAAPAVEADAQLVGFGESIVDTRAKQAAKNAGVQSAAFINYDTALGNYAARNDVEDLAHKNARDIPSDFSDADFMRKVDADAQDHASGVGN